MTRLRSLVVRAAVTLAGTLASAGALAAPATDSFFRPPSHHVPELSSQGAGAALVLVLGGIAVLAEARRRRSPAKR